MSSGQSFSRNKGLLAAAVGAGVIIGAAGLYLYHSLNKKKKLIEEQMTRLDLNLSKLSKELVELRHMLVNNRRLSTSSSSKRSKSKNSFSSSKSGYETEDSMYTALNSDDEEFYDLNSEDEDTFAKSLQEDSESKTNDAKLFEEVDLLMKGDDEDRLNAFNLLKKYEYELSENPDFLWRYAKAFQMQAVVCGVQDDLEGKKKYVCEGLEYASKALSLDETNPDVHKWFAILTGMEGDFLPMKQKIHNGFLFQKHIVIAIQSKPQDYSLHHLLGRFKFEVANTSWLLKKIAMSIFPEIPEVTFSDAITDLLAAEELNPVPWKENRLLLSKCYIGDGKFYEAIQWLDSAKEITPKTKEDAASDREISILMEQCKKYRK